MIFGRLKTDLLALCIASAVLVGATPATSLAQSATAVPPSPVQADFKGAIGLGLIGAELGFVLPAAFGMRQTWAYIVFPILGAGGGATAGYFALEQGAGHPEVAVAMLVTGVALLIPSLVFTVARTAYAEDDVPTQTTAQVAVPEEVRRAAEAGPGLLRLSQGDLMVRPPAVSVGQSAPERPALNTGDKPFAQYQVALLSGRF